MVSVVLQDPQLQKEWSERSFWQGRACQKSYLYEAAIKNCLLCSHGHASHIQSSVPLGMSCTFLAEDPP